MLMWILFHVNFKAPQGYIQDSVLPLPKLLNCLVWNGWETLIRRMLGGHESTKAPTGLGWGRESTGVGIRRCLGVSPAALFLPGGLSCYYVCSWAHRFTTLGLQGLFSKMRTRFLGLLPPLSPTQCHRFYVSFWIWGYEKLNGWKEIIQYSQSLSWMFVIMLCKAKQQ